MQDFQREGDSDELYPFAHCVSWHFFFLFLFLHSAHTHSGEECELTCRETNNEVVILPSNMSVEAVLREHWRVPHKVRVSVVSVFSWLPPRSGCTDALHGAPRSAAAPYGISRTASTSRRNANSQSGAPPVVPGAVQMFVLGAWQPFKHFHSIFGGMC